MCIPATQRQTLRAAGSAVIVNDRLEPADLIVVMFNTDGAGALEAADLVRTGIGSRIAVFADPPDPVVDPEFLPRGLPYEDMAAREIGELTSVGADKVKRITKPRSGATEGPILAKWCGKRRVQSVIVIINLSESRLVRRQLHRSMKPHHIKVVIRSAPYPDIHSDRWWQTHGEIRT